MPRKYRIIEPGYYHVINRGVERRNVFLEPDDYDKFLEILTFIKGKFGIKIHAFCLMTNHYHVLLETHIENISEAVKYLNENYATYFNKKYKRSGHLWQGRFLSYYLFDETHFWNVAKYIERNPIKANLVKKIKDYKYQSFFQRKYNSTYVKLLENSMVFNMELNDYEIFISTELSEDILESIYVSPKMITQQGERKILSKRLETFFEEDRDIHRSSNANNAYKYGYTKSQIANHLNLTLTTISKYISKSHL